MAERNDIDNSGTIAMQTACPPAAPRIVPDIALDLGNVLTALSGFAYLLKMKMDTDDPMWQYVGQIVELSERACHLAKRSFTFTNNRKSRPLEGRETILIADDEKEVRAYTKLVLEEFGYRAILAEDGEDAISKFAAHQNEINLVILDVRMPKRNGREVCKTILGIKPNAKILYMSGYAAEVFDDTAGGFEGWPVMPKPVPPQELLKKIRIVLGDQF